MMLTWHCPARSLCAPLSRAQAPYKVKLGVLYSAMGLLGVLFGLTVVRLIIFTVLWVVTGRSLWLLPNLYSDDVPISHILSPLWAEDAPVAGKGGVAAAPPSLARRLAVAAGAAALVHALYRATPDGKGVVSNLKGANKSILEMLNLHEPPKSIGGGGGENATAAVSVAAPGGLGGLGGMGGMGGMGGGSAVPPTAATAAAQALQRGAAGPAGGAAAAAAREEALAEALRNLAPIPDDPDLEEEGPSAAKEAAKEEGEKEAHEAAQGGEGETKAPAAAHEAQEAHAAGEAETEAEL
jgi:hypothetical protein